jgi:hypothetical protein
MGNTLQPEKPHLNQRLGVGRHTHEWGGLCSRIDGRAMGQGCVIGLACDRFGVRVFDLRMVQRSKAWLQEATGFGQRGARSALTAATGP